MFAWKIGRLVMLTLWNFKVGLSSYYGSETIGTMPDGWKPAKAVIAPLSTNDVVQNLQVAVDTAGSITVSCSSGGEPPEDKPVKGQVVFVTAS